MPTDGLLTLPRGRPKGWVVLAPGAGADMHHVWLEAFAQALAAAELCCLRYQFPFLMAAKKRPPDRPALLQACVRSACAHAVGLRCRAAQRDVPLVAAGKSLGGRMTIAAAAAEPLAEITALFCLGYPLYPAKRPDKAAERAAPLARLRQPLLIVQGSRDALGTATELQDLCRGQKNIAVVPLEQADHAFHLPARWARTHNRSDAQLRHHIVAQLHAFVAALRPAPVKNA